MTGPCSAHHIAFADCPACQAAVPADLRVCQFCGGCGAVTAMTYHRVECERDTLRVQLTAANARITDLLTACRRVCDQRTHYPLAVEALREIIGEVE